MIRTGHDFQYLGFRKLFYERAQGSGRRDLVSLPSHKELGPGEVLHLAGIAVLSGQPDKGHRHQTRILLRMGQSNPGTE
jgi:hypothetical protein